MAIFPTFIFLSNIGQENVFYDILERKNALKGYKNKKLKKSKNWRFSKGVNPWFWSKNGHFSNFFLGTVGQKNVFYNILNWKNAFLGHKNKKFKKSKNRHFPSGVNPWFWSKNGHFSSFYFLGNIGQENVFYAILVIVLGSNSIWFMSSMAQKRKNFSEKNNSTEEEVST